MVVSHHFLLGHSSLLKSPEKRLVFGLNPRIVQCRKNRHLMLKNVTTKNGSATQMRQRETAIRRFVWWSKSREEPLARISSVAPFNKE